MSRRESPNRPDEEASRQANRRHVEQNDPTGRLRGLSRSPRLTASKGDCTGERNVSDYSLRGKGWGR